MTVVAIQIIAVEEEVPVVEAGEEVVAEVEEEEAGDVATTTVTTRILVATIAEGILRNRISSNSLNRLLNNNKVSLPLKAFPLQYIWRKMQLARTKGNLRSRLETPVEGAMFVALTRGAFAENCNLLVAV